MTFSHELLQLKFFFFLLFFSVLLFFGRFNICFIIATRRQPGKWRPRFASFGHPNALTAASSDRSEQRCWLCALRSCARQSSQFLPQGFEVLHGHPRTLNSSVLFTPSPVQILLHLAFRGRHCCRTFSGLRSMLLQFFKF